MIAEKNGITVDTRTAAPARKMIKCPQKTGINLNLQEDRQRDRRTLLIGILAIAALVTVVVNFGVLQQYRRLDKAQAAYDRVHTQYVSAQEALSDYDRVLLEYRTYSMDWMTAAGSEDIPAAVDRQAALDLLEQEVRDRTPRVAVDDSLRRRSFEVLPAGGLAARTRAMLKVEDGCVNFCTYCIIPFARGPVLSLIHI